MTIRKWLMVVLALVACAPAHARHGSQFANQNLSVGLNLAPLQNGPFAFPFLNILKYGPGWNTDTGEDVGMIRYDVDTNGYPLSLAAGAITGTFTASISNQSGGGGVSAGGIMDVTALLTGSGPWFGGSISGTGVTTGAISPATGQGTCTVSGSTLTVASAAGVWGRGQIVYLSANSSEGQQIGTITANAGGTGGNGNYTLNASPAGITGRTCASIQPMGNTGTYNAPSQATSSRTITIQNRFTYVRTETFLPGCAGAYPGPVLPCYPQGKYVLAWDGAGTIALNNDFVTSSCPSCGTNRALFTASGSVGFQFRISATTPGNNLTNARLIYCPDCADGIGGSTTPGVNGTGTREALFNQNVANGITWGGFDPVFLNLVKNYKGFRFMDWSHIVDGSALRNWADVLPTNWVFYNASRYGPIQYGAGSNSAFGGLLDGVPPAVALELCKELNADCYLNIPKTASANYVTNLATLALSMLPAPLHVYVEPGNEAWNQVGCASNTLADGSSSGTMTEWCVTQVGDIACSLVSYCGHGNFSENIFYNAWVSAYYCNLWKGIWTGQNTSRVTCVWGGQNGCVGCVSALLDEVSPGAAIPFTGTVGQNVDAVALAPYVGQGFGSPFVDAFSGDADYGAQRLMDQMRQGTFPTASMGTTGGTAGAYTVTTGLGLSGSPPNGKMICIVFNQTNTINPTIAVDSMAAAPLMFNDGSLTGTTLPASTIGVGSAGLLVWTKAVAGGTPTAGWRGGPACDQVGNFQIPIAGTLSFTQAWITYLGTHYPLLVIIGYEGGQQVDGGTTNAIASQEYAYMWRSPQAGQFYDEYLTAWKNLSNTTLMFLYTEFGPLQNRSDGGFQSAWGNLESGLQSSSPRYNATTSWNARHPCWWTNCQNYLLKRDLDPASNDNSPAFMDKAA